MPSEQAEIHESDGWAESGPREACAHPGIHGSYHRYDVLEWWPADEEPGPFGQETPHPVCPVDECASGDDGHECRIICERIPTKNGSGAWKCNLHGYFRVFGYPREEEPETETEQAKLVTDGGAREQPTDVDRPFVVDLYCGAGGVGIELDRHDFRHIGVDIVDYSESYPGEFVRGDASQPPIQADADLVWASPPCQAYSSLSVAHYGSAEAAREVHPTIPELDVREVCRSLTGPDGHYIIENVKRCEHLREPTEVNGYGVGLHLSNPRLFETSFPVPDAVDAGSGAVSAGGKGSESVALREEKGLPDWITGNDINQAIPPRMVQYLLHYCPSTPDVPLPDGVSKQSILTEVTALAE